MADVATLGLEVRSDQVEKGSRALDQLTNSAKRAQAAASGVSTATKNAGGVAANANFQWETYEETVARLGVQQKKVGAATVAATAAVKAETAAVQVAGQRAQVASVGFAAFASAVRLVSTAIGGFLMNALSVGFGVLLADLAKLVDWGKLAANAIIWVADALVAVAPYAVGAAAALALLYAPALVGGLFTLIGLLGQLSVAALGVAASFAAANPAAAFVLGITAAVAAANIFRDELTQIFGIDIVGAAKTGANYVIGSFVAAFEDLKFVWNQFPNIVGAAAVGAANAALSAMESMINTASGMLNGLISSLNNALASLPGGFQIGEIGQVDFGEFNNPFAKALSGAVADRNAAVQGALSRDYLGEFGSAISSSASAASAKLKELAGSFTNVEDAAGKAGRAAKGAAGGAKDPWDGLRNAVDRTKDAMSFARDLAGGFLSDLRSGLKQGEGFWASFKNAALNALDKIVDKLLNNVLDALFQVNSAGSGIGGGGGGIGGLLGGIFSIFGFARGGFTGRGGASEVAGVVHGGEYVFSKRATDRIGVGALEQLHRTAKGYANGGHVTPAMPRVQAPANGNGEPREVIVRVVGEAGPMFIPTIQAESKDVAVQVTQAGIGQYDKQLNRTLGGKIANAQSRQL
ncbi:hypothetical protein [Hoeflea sp. 108]|uniref:hypothetical protein n=1 Tax=Hoeflea sp. 108 TaxID=1116369 RepID=UPI0003797E05|nr:hypothetical protein [Hoeflea sp. 108]